MKGENSMYDLVRLIQVIPCKSEFTELPKDTFLPFDMN